jgi:hypothetical protein
MPTAEEWIFGAAGRLGAAGYAEQPGLLVNGHPVRAFRRADFKIRWMFTRLHTFVVLGHIETATKEDMIGFPSAALAAASAAKGGLPNGLQTGTAVLPVLVAGTATDEARGIAMRRPDKDFGAMKLPLLVDLSGPRAYTFTGAMVWGLAYAAFLKQQQRTVAGELATGW